MATICDWVKLCVVGTIIADVSSFALLDLALCSNSSILLPYTERADLLAEEFRFDP